MRRLAVMTWILAGCGSGGERSSLAATALMDADGTTGGDPNDGIGENTAEPSSWELSGVLHVIQNGVLEGEDTSMEVRLLDADRNTLCSAEVVADTVTTLQTEQFPDDALLGWWRIYISAPEAPSCFADEYDFPVPEALLLGVGDMDPEIRAVAGSDPSLSALDSLNAAYASLDRGDTLWVFGVAGTASAFAGEATSADEIPLPEGDWTIEPLYPFPL
jgi:hypothetical protein